MQRLFSTFADGWPGAGLLLLRLLTGAALVDFGIGGIREGPPPLTVALQIVGIAAAILLLVGAFTPLAGIDPHAALAIFHEFTLRAKTRAGCRIFFIPRIIPRENIFYSRKLCVRNRPVTKQ